MKYPFICGNWKMYKTIAEAKEFADEILKIVKNNWERLAKEYGLTRGQIENMRPAFCNVIT